jgi:hypothetical protein
LKEDFDLPAAAIQISDTAGAPLQIVGQKLHLPLLAVDFHQSPYSAHRFGIIDTRVFVFEHNKLVAQDALSVPFGSLLTTLKQSPSLLTPRNTWALVQIVRESNLEADPQEK